MLEAVAWLSDCQQHIDTLKIRKNNKEEKISLNLFHDLEDMTAQRRVMVIPSLRKPP